MLVCLFLETLMNLYTSLLLLLSCHFFQHLWPLTNELSHACATSTSARVRVYQLWQIAGNENPSSRRQSRRTIARRAGSGIKTQTDRFLNNVAIVAVATSRYSSREWENENRMNWKSRETKNPFGLLLPCNLYALLLRNPPAWAWHFIRLSAAATRF